MTKLLYFHIVIFIVLLCNGYAVKDDDDYLVGREQVHYRPPHLEDSEFLKLSRLSDAEQIREAVREILVPRIVGTPGHKKVREYIVQDLTDLQWTVELQKFHEHVPILGKLHFQNIIAKLNPQAERYFVLACHYDSKYMPDYEFLGATDSAVPCAILLNLAHVLREQLQALKHSNISLMFIFFDGEEAFDQWSTTDSIYGSRKLAEKWEADGFLNRIDILMLLDLIGAPDPQFYSFYKNTESWYSRLMTIEERLSDSGFMERYTSSGVSRQHPNLYFQPNALRHGSLVEDDHMPFLKRNVPILHIIPLPFPTVWHTQDDNESVIDYTTTENIARIVRIFTMEYLLGHNNSSNSSSINDVD